MFRTEANFSHSSTLPTCGARVGWRLAEDSLLPSGFLLAGQPAHKLSPSRDFPYGVSQRIDREIYLIGFDDVRRAEDERVTVLACERG